MINRRILLKNKVRVDASIATVKEFEVIYRRVPGIVWPRQAPTYCRSDWFHM